MIDIYTHIKKKRKKKKVVGVKIFYEEANEDEEETDEDTEEEEGLPLEEPSGELRQIGQVPFILSHSSTQVAWK